MTATDALGTRDPVDAGGASETPDAIDPRRAPEAVGDATGGVTPPAAPATAATPATAADAKPRTSSRRGPRATPKPPRRRAREFALQALYGVMVGRSEAGEADAHVRELDGFAGIDLAWYDRQLHGTVAARAELEALFVPHLDRPVAQLSPIEHAVLLLGTWELAHAPDVPWKVALDASIELAKAFGGTDGHKFVNGVLDRVSRTLRPDERRRDGAPTDPEPTDG